MFQSSILRNYSRTVYKLPNEKAKTHRTVNPTLKLTKDILTNVLAG